MHILVMYSRPAQNRLFHSPDAVEDSSVGEDPDIHVWHGDFVQLSRLLVLEEEIGHPYFLRVSQRQVLNATCPADSISD